jgi:hypothetical protein
MRALNAARPAPERTGNRPHELSLLGGFDNSGNNPTPAATQPDLFTWSQEGRDAEFAEKPRERRPKKTIGPGKSKPAAKSPGEPGTVAVSQAEPNAGFVSWGDFTMRAKGLYTSKVRKGDDASADGEWISSAFEVIGACRDPHGCGWGKWLRWRDADGRIHTRHVSNAALQGDPSTLCSGLADEGLNINRNQQRALVAYLGGCNVKSRVTIVDRTGWHGIGGHQVFVLPDDTIGPKGSERVILDASAVGPV